MKLAVSWMVAFLLPIVPSEDCRCRYPNQQYTGDFWAIHRTFVRLGFTQARHKVGMGKFFVDLDGYYYRASVDHPTEGPIHIYADDQTHLVCYEGDQKLRAQRHCDRNVNTTLIFPRCVSSNATFQTAVEPSWILRMGDIYQRYVVAMNDADDTCKPERLMWSDDRLQHRAVAYLNIKVDTVPRNKYFFLEEVKGFFPGMSTEEILG